MDTTTLKCMFSSMKLDYATPDEVFKQLDDEFHFNLDACASKENAKVSNYFDKEKNGLVQNWYGNVFVNPPYGKSISLWIKKGYEEFINGNAEVVVFLIPSRTDTKYWHEYIMKATEIRFVKGRIKFNGKNSAPFPSAVVVFRK